MHRNREGSAWHPGRPARWVFGLVTTLLMAHPSVVYGQAWVSRHQQIVWVSGSVDQAVSERTSLWLDASWRRMEQLSTPQQFIVRPGAQYLFSPGVRAAGGYAFSATQPYGQLPSAAPAREHRLWQQLTLAHRSGPLTVSHRYRLEQRWTHPLLLRADSDGRETGPTSYQNRFRYLGRFQTALGPIAYNDRPLIASLQGELLMQVGGGSTPMAITQQRAAAGLGIPLSRTLRLDASYMVLTNAMASRRANEVNHVFTLGWSFTASASR